MKAARPTKCVYCFSQGVSANTPADDLELCFFAARLVKSRTGRELDTHTQLISSDRLVSHLTRADKMRAAKLAKIIIDNWSACSIK
jgi:hypothetical protein